MWVEETKNGKFKAVERYTDYLTGKVKKVSVTIDKNTAQSRKAAQVALAEKIKVAYQNKPEEKRLSLEDLVALYRDEQKLTVKPSTYRRNYFFGNALIDVFGGNTLVDRLDANYLRNTLIKLNKTSDQKNEILKRFKTIIRWGYTHDLIDDVSYLDKVERFSSTSRREKIRDKFLESEDVLNLISSMKSDVWRAVTEFLSLSGLRFGELAALNKNDVDFEERVIRVSKTYDVNNDVTTSAKSTTSERDVYMQDELLKVAKKINLMMLHQKMMYGYNSTTLFFADKKGKHINYCAYNKYLQESSVKSIGRAITPHVLRHTHASLLMEQGVSIDTISRRLGHSDSKITREIYLHVTEKLKAKEREQLKKIKIM